MSSYSSLVPEGMVPEVTGATVLLDLADGSQVAIKVPKARWELFAETHSSGPLAMDAYLDDLALAGVTYEEHWWGLKWHPLETLPGRNAAKFRLTHILPERPDARYRVEGGPGEDDLEHVAGDHVHVAERAEPVGHAPEPHRVIPLDGVEGGWRCTCGLNFVSETGWAICPSDPGRPGADVCPRCGRVEGMPDDPCQWCADYERRLALPWPNAEHP